MVLDVKTVLSISNNAQENKILDILVNDSLGLVM